jgi:hypothetical protein
MLSTLILRFCVNWLVAECYGIYFIAWSSYSEVHGLNPSYSLPELGVNGSVMLLFNLSAFWKILRRSIINNLSLL